jgi:hypothetical protein
MNLWKREGLWDKKFIKFIKFIKLHLVCRPEFISESIVFYLQFYEFHQNRTYRMIDPELKLVLNSFQYSG